MASEASGSHSRKDSPKRAVEIPVRSGHPLPGCRERRVVGRARPSHGIPRLSCTGRGVTRNSGVMTRPSSLSKTCARSISGM